MKVKFSHLSIFFSSTFLLGGMLLGNFIGMYFKSVNPEDRDITQGLAYLSYILIPTFAVVILGWLAALITLLMARRTEQDDTTRFARTLLIIMTLLTVALAVTNKINSNIVDNYEKTHKVQTQ